MMLYITILILKKTRSNKQKKNKKETGIRKEIKEKET